MNVDRLTMYEDAEYEGAVSAERRPFFQNVLGRTLKASTYLLRRIKYIDSHNGGGGRRKSEDELISNPSKLGVEGYVNGLNDLVYE